MKKEIPFGLKKKDYLAGVVCLVFLSPQIISNILMQFFGAYANSDVYEALAMVTYIGVAFGGLFLMISFVVEIVLLVRAVKEKDVRRQNKKTMCWHLSIISLVVATFAWQSVAGIGWNHGLQGTRQRERLAQTDKK